MRRIFKEYIAGVSPRTIAMTPNKEGIAGPQGGAWGASTIYGNRERGTGILNNELYIDRLIWNRLRYIKDPSTRKRVSQMNPQDAWIIKDVPELRILDQELWDEAKRVQGEINKHDAPLWKMNRPKHLLSHLLCCGSCGGGYSMIGAKHVGCSTARNKGTCENRLTMEREKLEHMV
ncbi:recombinase family protein [Rhizobium sp. 32-5/1]|uniref:recombinase family protein n=1 Tax=Rhizobium sp. 32-5/1 TaxID=3019602 RepID=UPI00240CF9FA|nr:recombinase family protein [Rhizobium sp. 32-5/1]WEZ82305.1 recombinase family protein [Rhizobium sp. 32-5/1]